MFKLLTTFKAVYETKNFSTAAEQLFISQPAVSNQIKQLEEELNTPLFYRNGRKEIAPTKPAEVLYLRLLNLSDDWKETLSAMNNQEILSEKCTIIASNTFSSYYLPQLIVALTKKFPELTFTLEMHNSEEVVEKIKKHEADFGFIEKPLLTGDIPRIKILTDKLVLAGDLSSSLWLIREPSSGVFHYTERYFLEQNIQPQKMIIKNNELIIKCLTMGLGKSIVSKKAVPKGMPSQELGENYQRAFYFINRQHLKSKQLQQVAEFATSFYQTKKS
ncbi:LysR family transcriptional regulator [Carnobacterium gallinarum]|uniref:LysR family transcriptional regulator n=1 Tax=Carnobacterium gallinarum TaxID=2749 RepID=UPI000557DA14|nr:LysR family transcriptional regulator [Carnobacterium gallinarum]